MTDSYRVHVYHRQKGTDYAVQVPADRYILQTAENQGADLPFACRNGACTTCAVRVLSGAVRQPEAMGLSLELRRQGYALLCVSYPCSDLEVETQDEDEVYELQFGRYFGKGKVRFGLPLDED
ncbi:MAG: 2Fe-2S iron-sulfur cluster binding domain-containing protein [Leptolyngbyaceae cyanobacterium SM1_1_3]|nr:2Fe-2S iron-sulfur cluster binding domain-containing protein [Leptolyngbyaceae cyanobacterium SM1_1_3]NJM85288.1 2Fe-2S iron-sulfur cluster binding domain-containing protein [Leptolyngbyaceae cyanobacterium RM2_2_21]NJN01488.1 2Fe-2S iron-sulfur cluster binding domain-containing protein [Leptolyngbyaceae cyanobacterium RM1_1_2]NJO08699.1 2Fe-2S iron-sulfur cluster binding domain-containing protein [Leptolyngbyaceae cyanobacterium SL_1_1]